ncbi:MAG: alpha/beta hydrolase [Ruminococcus sp.]|nr:alpha/beta hydrolase [Ruminococcus sp.]
MKRLIQNTAAALSVGSLCICAAMYRYGVARKLYVIPKILSLLPSDSPSQRQYKAVRPALEAGREWFEAQPCEQKRIRSFDGLALYARYLACAGSEKTVILCHGWRGTGLGDFGGIIRYLYEQLKLNILLIDERAQGKSEGKHMTYGIKERFDIADWARLIAREHPSHRIYLYGVSMGAASVLMSPSANLPQSVCGLIADCGYTSPDDIFRSTAKNAFHLPPFPFVDVAELFARIFAHFDFSQCSAKQTLSQCDLPVIFFHGAADDFVPAYMSEQNYAAAKGEKQIVKIDGAFHATSYYIGFQKYTSALKAFIERH